MVSDSVMDERTLHEIYLPAFETVVKKAKPLGVMAAYNKLNGTHCSENKELLTDILRKRWGYEGMVVDRLGRSKRPRQGHRRRTGSGNARRKRPRHKLDPFCHQGRNALGGGVERCRPQPAAVRGFCDQN